MDVSSPSTYQKASLHVRACLIKLLTLQVHQASRRIGRLRLRKPMSFYLKSQPTWLQATLDKLLDIA